ncbi:METTL5 family protein [Methanobrevibacter sp.]|uniref:METTL5 family protein n=1 Tax=Methanobrevibacter sp. TaxID=66852 RepID=UPI0025F4E585|nr:METTL5 family protein [Methanobrevibacter sp.]MBR4447000.1 methyltransferase domain-containing protein [Methanobrevibacter sp.]
MKKITRKKHLEMKLQSVPAHPKPKVGLEQYTTPSVIASDLIWNAYSLGDVEGRDIVDLGCGTGIFAIGSSLMGANSSVGVDIDEDSIKLAQELKDKLKLTNLNFIVSNIDDFNESSNVDTVFQNPPFGSQKNADSGQDLRFIQKAIELETEVLYSFHMQSTEDFLIKYYEDNDFEITHIFRYKFPIPKIYDFHTKEKQNVNVIVIRAILK